MNDGGYFELSDGTRYTCTSADGCAVANGTVTRGTVAGRAAGSGEVDRFPSFRGASNPGAQTYTVGTAIDTLTLPEASSGNAPLSYSLTPSVPGLTFNATTRQLTGTPSTAGTYAMTYTVTDEDDDTDTLSFTITVSTDTDDACPLDDDITCGQVSEPDLVVQSLSVGDTSLVVGESFALNATVRNQGAVRAAATTLRYYRSTDATISTADTEVGTDAVSGLAAAAAGIESISVTAPSTAGTYYYGACVDPVSGESNSQNNCSTAVRVAVSASQPNQADQADQAVLAALYEATNGPNWVNSDNWLTDAPLGDWNGVDTDDSGRVVRLALTLNNLAGSIPLELGNLASLQTLYLGRNFLSGPIPPELGDLSTLGMLILDKNDLTGPVPPELAGMSRLTELTLANNPEMFGALPAELTNLGALQKLVAWGTALCAPQDPGFQSWLQRIHSRRITPCGSAGASMASMAHLTQAVQSREYPVPLVAGEQALLRVFVTAARTTTASIPPVRARFYLNGTERHVTDIAGKTAVIPTEVLEHDLSVTANADIPGEVVQPGLEMVIEIDPDGTLDPSLGVPTRIPETGRMAVEVHEMPVFDLTVIPFLWSADPDRAVLEAAEGMAADPEGHELLWKTRTLLPVGDLEVTAHAPVLSSSNSKFVLLSETSAIRAMEGGTGHYMAMMSGGNDRGGVAHARGRVSYSDPHSGLIAHELGHNLSLGHPWSDLSFPYYSYPQGGHIGAWGYDFRGVGRLVPPHYWDIMSRTGDGSWISDYYFTNALRFRLFDEGHARGGRRGPEVIVRLRSPGPARLGWQPGNHQAVRVRRLGEAFQRHEYPHVHPARSEHWTGERHSARPAAGRCSGGPGPAGGSLQSRRALQPGDARCRSLGSLKTWR